MEVQQADSSVDVDIDSVIQPISERLEKLESDVGAIALSIQDLSTRVSDLEGVALRQQDQAAISVDSDLIAEIADPGDITTDVEQIAEPQPPAPLTQSALARRLGCSDKAIEKHRRQGSENFAVWSRDRDPENVANQSAERRGSSYHGGWCRDG